MVTNRYSVQQPGTPSRASLVLTVVGIALFLIALAILFAAGPAVDVPVPSRLYSGA